MTDSVSAIKAVRARFEQALENLRKNPDESKSGVVGELNDAILDLKMIVYHHDPHSPLYEAVAALPSQTASRVISNMGEELIVRALSLIDKFLDFSSVPE